MVNLSPIINAVIGLVAALITVFLIPYLHKKNKAEDLAISISDFELLEKEVKKVVEAAQQTMESAGDRKKWVMERLEEKGYTIDDSVLDTIEAAVLKLHLELYGEWEK